MLLGVEGGQLFASQFILDLGEGLAHDSPHVFSRQHGQQVHHWLVTLVQLLPELHISATQHSLGMRSPSHWLNEVSVCGWRNSKPNPDRHVP